jgi:GAF domain-containing protein
MLNRMSDHGQFNRELAAAAREMQGESSSQAAMDTAVALAVKMFDGCDAAAVSIVHRGERIDSPAVTDGVVREVDEMQFRLGEGPCFDALDQHDTVHSNDLSIDERWPNWGPKIAAEMGMWSIVSYRLFSNERSLGALNLYGRARSSFTTEEIGDGLALAAHVAVALAAAQKMEQLTLAVDTRTLIGQATGMLMERYDLSPDRAFGVLSRLSQHRNVKLRELAEHVVTTRALPEG